ncbi:hypothetical protein [Thalassomonas actiniarum]|uniref:Uncharacterized protein n=1 Tax=Thalassomonas actiniarum TaxID=485447 RepID=A0AAE9YRP5_9GAMM|nr:hypothetical protein [Thalassomonas actiniarum]WDD99810.1 hypothetical protein SG35_003820 [Thalassomonas actiniarum]
MEGRIQRIKYHWRKWTLGLALIGAAAWYWYLYSGHLDTARLVSVQMCVIEEQQKEVEQVRTDELIEFMTDLLINRKLAGDSFIERLALKNAIYDGLTCAPFDSL